MRVLVIPLLAALMSLLAPQQAEASCGTYGRYRHVHVPPSSPVGYPACCTNGYQGFSFCNGICPDTVKIYTDVYDCETDQPTGMTSLTADVCTCAGPGLGGAYSDSTALAKFADNMIALSAGSKCNASCLPTSEPEPQVCNQKGPLEIANGDPVDPGCGDDEQKCTSGRGTDDFPVNLSSGRVETKPITVFSVPTPSGIDFGWTIKYSSHDVHGPAQKQTIGGVADSVPLHHTHPMK